MRAWIISLLFITMACQGKINSEKEINTTAATEAVEKEEPEARMPGSDRDEHGCIPSAGYTWSQAKQECVRIWEEGTKLQAPDNTGRVAYLLFSADQEQAEIFLPDSTNAILLQRKGSEGAHTWEAEGYSLFPWKGYVLKKGDKVMYTGG